MFLRRSRVLKGHLAALEIDHLCIELKVYRMERALLHNNFLRMLMLAVSFRFTGDGDSPCGEGSVQDPFRTVCYDTFVKSRSHTKNTEDTKKNLNVFNMPFFVPLCLRVKN